MSDSRRVFAGFAIYSFAFGSMFPRMVDIRAAMGVEEGALGLALIGAPLGTLVSLTFAGPLLARIGNRVVLLAGTVLLALGYAIAIHATGPLALFLLLVPVGLVIGGVEIILNLEADRVEHAEGRRIMNRAHAFWSFGFMSAGLFGAVMAGIGLSPQVHLALVVPLTVLAVWLFLADFVPATPRPEDGAPARRFAAPTWPILVLVCVTLPAMLLEGGSIDWAAIYMTDTFQSGAFLSGLAVAVVTGFQALTRFFADAYVQRHSPAAVARWLLGVLLLGNLIVVLSPSAMVSLAGFALIGIGASVMFPLAMSAAARRTDRPAALNVAALAQFSFMIFLLAPPFLGLIAEHFGIRNAFALGLPLIALGFLTVSSLGEDAAR
jgi:MFS family permease